MNGQRTKKAAYRFISDYLTYNKTEQKGLAVLLFLLGLVILANCMIPARTAVREHDLVALRKEAALFELSWQAASDSDSVARALKYQKLKMKYSGYKNFTSVRPAITAHSSVRVELNSADTLDLQQLKGIGPAFARRIVSYRVRLRGFYDPSQLLEVFGMDSSRFALIQSCVEVNRDSVKPFNMNTVTFKEMLRHPYFPFPVAKNIVRYRSEHKGFTSVNDLRDVPGVTDSLFRRMVFYISLGP